MGLSYHSHGWPKRDRKPIRYCSVTRGPALLSDYRALANWLTESSQPVTTPAGWYPDPDGSGGRRYFDGQSWTEHRAAAVEAPPLEAATPAPRTSGPNGKVIAGVIAAVVVLIVVGLAAVVLTLKSDVGDTTVTRGPSDASAATTSQSATGVEAPTLENQADSVGQPVRDGNFEFVVAGIDRGPAVADPEFPELQKTAAGEYIFVNMKVTNVGTKQ